MFIHLKDSKMSYMTHFFYAASFSVKLLKAAFYVFYHGVHPTEKSHWKGRGLIVQAFNDLPHAPDKVIKMNVEKDEFLFEGQSECDEK
jgi:hypothetical protein